MSDGVDDDLLSLRDIVACESIALPSLVPPSSLLAVATMLLLRLRRLLNREDPPDGRSGAAGG